MPSLANGRVATALLIFLLAASLGLKGMRGQAILEPAQPLPGYVESNLARTLRSQGFSTKLQQTRLHGTIVHAARGNCRLSVRDASHAAWEMAIYARDAASIGPVRYLLSGKSYDSPPSVPILIGRHKARLLRALGRGGSAPVALALATSSDCGNGDFGLSETQVPI